MSKSERKVLIRAPEGKVNGKRVKSKASVEVLCLSAMAAALSQSGELSLSSIIDAQLGCPRPNNKVIKKDNGDKMYPASRHELKHSELTRERMTMTGMVYEENLICSIDGVKVAHEQVFGSALLPIVLEERIAA